MKTLRRSILAALLPVAALGIASCNSIDAEKVTTGSAEAGVPGGRVSETTIVNATVTGIDPYTRKVKFITPKGEKFTVTAGPGVANFNQIRVGDQLRATLTREVTLRMANPGETIQEGAVAVQGSAPLGAKPGSVAGAGEQYAGTVTAINLKKHTATLQFSDGSSSTLPVRADVDLTQRRVGERVVVTFSEVLAMGLEKP